MITVLGSMNIDEFFDVSHFVRPSETLAASAVTRMAGGKGLNQAIAAARAGADTAMAGMIGEDGTFLRDLLEQNGADCHLVETRTDTLTGRAVIQRTPDSENAILLSAGANHKIDEQYIRSVLSEMNPEDLLLIQNEISDLKFVLDCAREFGLPVIFNPAPMTEEAAAADLRAVQVLIVNQMEAMQLCGFDLPDKTEPEEMLIQLRTKGPQALIVLTLGSEGAICCEPGKEFYWEQRPYPVCPADSTGAGDTFTGYLSACLARKMPVPEALELASAAAALSVTRKGAAASIPLRSEAEALMQADPEIRCEKRMFARKKK